MPFEQFNLTKSVNQSRDIFDKYIYRSSSDTLSEIRANNYFAESRFLRDEPEAWKGAIIEVIGTDGYAVLQVSDDGLSVVEVGSGVAFALGPVDNIFGATSGDGAAVPLAVSPAANRAAAVTVRNSYFTANPANLAEYDADSRIGIYLFYTDNGNSVVEPQNRIGGEWRTRSGVVAVAGPGGMGTIDPNIPDGAILVKTTEGGTAVATGSSLREELDSIVSDKALMAPPGSVGVGSQVISNSGDKMQFLNGSDDVREVFISDRLPADVNGQSGDLKRFKAAASLRADRQVTDLSELSPKQVDGTVLVRIPQPTVQYFESFEVIPSEAGSAVFDIRFDSFNNDSVFTQAISYTTDQVATRDVTNITQASQAVVTFSNHTYVVGSAFVLDQVVGMTEINLMRAEVVSVNGNSVTVDIDSSAFSAYVSSGISYTLVRTDLGNPLTFTESHNLFVTVTPDAGSQIEFRGGFFDFTSFGLGSNEFAFWLTTQARVLTEVNVTDDTNVVSQIEAKTSSNRLDISKTRNVYGGLTAGTNVTIVTNDDGTAATISSTAATTAAGISVDDSGFGNIPDDIDNAQEGFEALNQLFGIVNSGQPGQPGSRFDGPFVPFTDSVNIGSTNFDLYAGKTALYARSDNARVNFILPTDAEITAEGVATDATVEFVVLNQAGTARFDTGLSPTNTVVIDVEGPNNIRRGSSTGTLLNFIEAHQNDLVTLTQSARGEPWVAVRVTLSSAALLLPSGLFRLQVGTRISANPALGFLAGFPVGTTPQAGDAYEVSVGNDDFGGYGVETGDVIVALQDNPNRQNSATNDDWIVIRNATNDIISLLEIHFLNTISESDSFSDQHLQSRSDVTEVLVWLSPYALDHAPFLDPSTDPGNPQSGETGEYIGGRELDDTGFEFEATSNQLGVFAGAATANRITALVYARITGSVSQTTLANSYLVHKGRDGNEIQRFKLSGTDAKFRTVTLDSIEYLALDDVGATDNFSAINYNAGERLEIVERITNRSFTFSDAVNVLAAIADGSLGIEKLEPNVQALIRSSHEIGGVNRAKLAGLQATTVSSDIPDNTEILVKLDSASSSNLLSDYIGQDQADGILSNYERVRNIFFLVAQGITVNGMRKVETPATTISVVSQGDITLDNEITYQAFSAALPAATTFDINNPIPDAWQINGTLDTSTLTGAQSTFKVDRDNLSDALSGWIQSLIPSTPTPVNLPENLQQFGRHLTVSTDTSSTWTKIEPAPIRADVSRQFAALWDENRRTFGNGNYFADILGVETIGFSAANVFYYGTPTDPLNRSFPGAQSYILNSNIRVRNTTGNSNITTSFRKIISFNYALERQLGGNENQNMLRVGPASSTAFMGLAEQEGLYLNLGRGDGAQQTRTVQQNLEVDGRQWGTRVGASTNNESEVIIPNEATGSFTVTIVVQLSNNGNDSGTHTETITISNVGADQNLGQRTFSFSGHFSPVVNITYEHDNNDLSVARRVLFLRPTQAFSNAALAYNVSATHSVTQTWNHPTTYAREPVNAGSGHDDFGLFDPHRYTTETVLERNRVLLMFQKWDESDTSLDPELAVRVIVDGEVETSDSNDNLHRLHRPASDFTFNDISFGNSICAVSHIQCYDYTGTPPSTAEMQRMYSHQSDWLGLFWPPGHAVDDVIIDANLELSSGHGVILTDATTSVRKLLEIDSGSVSIKDA